jgi:hypothetical protein
MKNFSLKLGQFVVLFSTIIFSQIAPPPNGVEQHDGFFLRLVPGFGYSQVSITYPDDMLPDILKGKDFLSFTGFPFANSIQIGGAVSDNLIIYGESGAVDIINPSTKSFNEEVETAEDFEVLFGGFGPGVTYYFMPANIYLSTTILAHFATIKSEGKSHSSNIGFGFNFMAGKEWWVGEQWGLGVSVYFRYGSQTDKDDEDLTISGYSFGALFSVTYN